MTARIAIGFINIVVAAFVALYSYTALSKLLHRTQFEAAMKHSPSIAKFAHYLSSAIPLIEISICVLLILPRTRTTGLISATLLMLTFTVYILYILNAAAPTPCTCGGIIQQLGWKAHLILNSSFVIAGSIAINRISRTPVKNSRQTINHF